jgi:hypothetical protein
MRSSVPRRRCSLQLNLKLYPHCRTRRKGSAVALAFATAAAISAIATFTNAVTV